MSFDHSSVVAGTLNGSVFLYDFGSDGVTDRLKGHSNSKHKSRPMDAEALRMLMAGC